MAPLALTQAPPAGMVRRAHESGSRAGVIFVSSTLAFAPAPYLASYAASKAFDLSFAEALARELCGEPADVLALCPGPTRTSFASDGFHAADVPAAASPARVAREGLAMLGRRIVHVTGPSAPVLHPVALGRWLAAGGIGTAVRLTGGRRG